MDEPDPAGFGCGVDLRADGLLHHINRALFHPFGYALAYDSGVSGDDATASRPQFMLLYAGERVEFASDADFAGRDLPEALGKALERARETLYGGVTPLRPSPPPDAAASD